MKPPEKHNARGTVADPDNPARQGHPLEQIAEEHLLQREMCAALDQLAGLTRPDPALAAEVLHHFDTRFFQHIRDEDIDLFPLLRQRSSPGDDINHTLDRLAGDHESILALADRVRPILMKLARDEVLPDQQEAETLSRFAAQKRRHLIVENAIVLPIARAHLTEEDQAGLHERMTARRNTKSQDDPE